MKGKRSAAFALALIMTLSLLVLPASAVSFTDMTAHWAREDVEYLAGQGIVKGVSGTTFAPDQAMTACEALLFCSRTTGVSDRDKAKIAAAWSDTLSKLLPADVYAWTATELAVCLETGILSETELRAMVNANSLFKTISRENLAMYLVRAMQLAPLAKSLTSYPLSFADTASISASLRPYVYLLSMYGIVKGDEQNRFLPQKSLTRAEMATMLRRAIDRMEDLGLYAELPEYTDYEWVGGTIKSVSTGSSGATLLTLESSLSGTHSINLPADVDIYENNMRSSVSALKAGQYARVNLDSRGTADSVRLGGPLTTYQGTVTDLDQKTISLRTSSGTQNLTIDRFTEVQVGQTVGDRTLIDLAGGYTDAVCYVDGMGHLAGLQLAGGTRGEEGLLLSVEFTAEGQLIRVSGFNGMIRRYLLEKDAAVTVDGRSATLTNSYAGDYVSLAVSNDASDRLTSVAVDTKSEYLQGSIRSISSDRASINSLTSSRSESYDLAYDAILRYEGEEVRYDDIRRNSFVTFRLNDDEEITFLDAWPGYISTEGVIDSITYGVPTTITLTTKDDQVLTYELDLQHLPDIYRDDEECGLDQLRAGDQVLLTVHYNEVDTIETWSRQANVAGTISKVTQDAKGVTLELELPGRTTETYAVSDSVTVTKDGKSFSLYSLKPGYQVSLVVNGESVLSIQVDKSTDAENELRGTVLVTDEKLETMTLLPESGSNPVQVDMEGARFVDAAYGWDIGLGDLDPGDTVQLFGGYKGSQFIANLVIRTK